MGENPSILSSRFAALSTDVRDTNAFRLVNGFPALSNLVRALIDLRPSTMNERFAALSTGDGAGHNLCPSSLLLPSLELSDTKVYAP